MTKQPTLTHEMILAEVRHWSVAERLALVRAVLKTLPTAPRTSVVRSPTLDRALGLAATEQPLPADAQTEAWLEEHRQEKYG